MSSKNKITGALAACAVVALMAGPAIAGKPMSVVEKKRAADAMAANHQAKNQVAPKTMAKAEASLQVSEGVTIVAVPEELHNYLTASPDAHGHMRVRDTDANGTPASTTAGASDEK